MRRSPFLLITVIVCIGGIGIAAISFFNSHISTNSHIQLERVDDSITRFTNTRYGFSIDVPNTLGVGQYKEGNASETDIFRALDGSATSSPSFQIFITPYAEATITPERLKKDIPNGDIRNPQEVILGAEKTIRAEIFESSDPVLGQTREVWLIHAGFIYEFTSAISSDVWLSQILATMRFVNA